jgi:hypothetical protein
MVYIVYGFWWGPCLVFCGVFFAMFVSVHSWLFLLFSQTVRSVHTEFTHSGTYFKAFYTRMSTISSMKNKTAIRYILKTSQEWRRSITTLKICRQQTGSHRICSYNVLERYKISVYTKGACDSSRIFYSTNRKISISVAGSTLHSNEISPLM